MPHPVLAPLFRLLSLTCLAVLIWLVGRYPLGPYWISGGLLVYAIALWRKPELWLFVLPASLPVLDLSSWTGWFFVREFDFLVLATIVVGYWRIEPEVARRRLPVLAKVIVALLLMAYAASAWKGAMPLPALDDNAFASYQSPYNSLRLLSGFILPLLLLPLLARRYQAAPDAWQCYFFPGTVVGLGLAGLVVLWERIAFPGLLDFARDYRVTGSFSDMHTGGAALDGYLMLALPFAAVYALRNRTLLGASIAGIIFAAGTYATLVTFSRATYAAYFVAMLIVMFALIKARLLEGKSPVRSVIAAAQLSRRSDAMEAGGPGRAGTNQDTVFKLGNAGVPRRSARAWVIVAMVALTGYVMVRVFDTGGYRTLAAVVGLFAAMLAGGSREYRGAPMGVAAAVIVAWGVIAILLFWMAPRSVYVSYAVALALLSCGLAIAHLSRLPKPGQALVLASMVCLAVGAVLVGFHWGGQPAMRDALLAAALAAALFAYNRRAAMPLWEHTRNDVVAMTLIGFALALTIPVAGNPYINKRFATVDRDMTNRSAHWNDGLRMIDADWQSTLFGMGLGTFPRNYFWRNSKGEFPGTHLFVAEGGERYLRLGGPRHARGYGELLRVYQIVTVEPSSAYRLELDLRSNADNAVIVMELCRKWLIYPMGCARAPLEFKVTSREWKRHDRVINTGNIGQMAWYGRPTVHFSLATEKPGTHIEVDNVALLDERGRNLLRNGDFSDGQARWFFSSDHQHLPWHAKNMLLHILFEQGWIGVLLMAAIGFYAFSRLLRRVWSGDLAAAASLAALSGFVIVGVFDSLLDITRLTFLLYLLLFAALLQPRRQFPPSTA